MTLRKVILGLVQMRMSGDQEENLTRASAIVRSAAEKGAEIVCLPELFSLPYFPQERVTEYEPLPFPNHITRVLSESARRNNVVLVGGSTYEKSGTKSYNTSFVFNEKGDVLGRYRKVHLPQDPHFYEQTYFSPGRGYRVFNTKYGKIGVLICFDQWYPEPARVLKLMGADLIIYPTAIGTIVGVDQTEGSWHNAWEAVQRGHAISNSVVVAAVNRVGLEGELSFWGGSFVCNQFGVVSARAGRREQVLIAECDFDLAREVEEGWGFLRNRVPGSYARLAEEP